MTQSSGPDPASSAAPGGLLRGKRYATPEVTVSYDAARCIHVRACVTGLPQVFDPAARPWIRPQNAGAALVAEVVWRCPSGALHAVLTAADGPEQNGTEQNEQPQRPTTITPLPDGPLAIRGELSIVTPQGEQTELRATLCRCGSSSNKPFCDGTHAKVGWKS
ncbi:(4Fe-4S)-binding protein [Deinococcus sp. UYEF24]